MKRLPNCLACEIHRPDSPSLLCKACKDFVRMQSRLIDLRIEKEDQERYQKMYGVTKPPHVNPFGD